mmetsp:Transcript_18621/g.36205  ORF Transcript_18621/g.36205 Transcript_18621/m.36205 type:complete len:325 (-) Transcript_18621:23-997(-)
MFRRPKQQLPTTSPSTFTPYLPSTSPSSHNHNKHKDTADIQQFTMEVSSQRRLHHSHGSSNQNKRFLQAILLTFTVAILLQLKKYIGPPPSSNCLTKQDQTWHGGHPASTKSGSCWCGSADGYCMCTPAVAIDIVLYSKSSDDNVGGRYDVWAVRRGDTGQLATIGGFVDLGETTERAVQREVEEETGIIIPDELIIPQSNNKKENQSAMKLIGVYSDPRRDNRRHIVSVAYALEFSPNVMTTKDGSSVPKAGDDAKEVIAVPLRDIGIKFKEDDWYADHLSILLDFKEQILDDGTLGQGLEDLNSQRKWELYGDVARSTCRKI